MLYNILGGKQLMSFGFRFCLVAALLWMSVPRTTTAAIVISEIFYNLSGAESPAVEWIEITNTGANPVDLRRS